MAGVHSKCYRRNIPKILTDATSLRLTTFFCVFEIERHRFFILLEIPRTHVSVNLSKDRGNSTGFAGKNTPQTTKSTSSRGPPTLTVTNEETQKKWMRSLARATNGVKTRATSVEDLEGLSELFATPPAVQITGNRFPKQQKSDNWLSSLAKATNGPRKRGVPVEDLEGVPEMFATPPCTNAANDQNERSSIVSRLEVKTEAASPDGQELHMTGSLEPSLTPSLRSSGKNAEVLKIVTPIQSSCTPSLRSGKTPAAKTAVTPSAMLYNVEEVLKPKKTPSLRNSAEDAITVHVVTPVQPSRTPSLRSAKVQSRVLSSECSDLELEFVQPVAPSKTPSMRSSAQAKAVSRKSVGNSSDDRKSLGLQGLTRLMKSPRDKNAVENVDDFFVPDMFASPKPQPKRYSRKSEGLQGVARLLKTPKAQNEVAEDSPKLDGIKTMMQIEKTLPSPKLVGLRILMKTPKTCQKGVDAEELFNAELFASPEDDLSQRAAESATQNGKDETPSISAIDLTSPKTEAAPAKRAKKIESEATPRTTRAKRKAPEDSVEPVPKRGRSTRGTAKKGNECETEAPSMRKAAQRKLTAKSKKTTAAAIQSTPKPFVFRRTQLEPIIEAPSPLPSFDDPDIVEKASNEVRKTRSVTETKSQSKAPLRGSRRGNRAKAKAQTSLEESSNEEVAKKCMTTRSKKSEGVKEDANKPGDTQQDVEEKADHKGDGKRTTRGRKVKEVQLSDVAPPIKTRATRSRRAEVVDEVVNSSLVEATVANQTTRRSRRAAKTIEESVPVLEETKLTRRTSREENHDKSVEIVPEMRCTRSNRKPTRDSKNVDKDILIRSTRGKNSKKGEEAKPKAIEATGGPRSARLTRGNSKEKASLEGDNAALQEKTQVPPDNSAKKSRPKRELKEKTAIKPRETRSTRSAKPAENEVELNEQSVRSTRGMKRNRHDVESVAPEPKRTRSSVQPRSVITRQTRSRSQK